MDTSNDHHEYCTGGFDPDDIVISGIAGRFPECDSVGDLMEALHLKRDLLKQTSKRFEKGYANLPFGSSGSLDNLDKLDAEFFGINFSQADQMDPGQRLIFEVSYEAMVDAGYDPNTELKGKRIGVYCAQTHNDAGNILLEDHENIKGNSLVGFMRTMNANKCSYAFDFHGPSYTVDSACSSSFVALWSAFVDLQDGRIDAAVVSATQICLLPEIFVSYYLSGILSPTSTSRPFDEKADGIVRSEAVTSLFLQKASTARRAYATVMHIEHMAAGYVPEGVYVPSQTEEAKLFKCVLDKCKISADEIQYVEAHGTGTKVGDIIELHAIYDAYCTETRKGPLYVGSVKSNLGHSEAAAGQCGAIKAIFSFETGFIAPNATFESPNPNCAPLINGELQVATEPLILTSPYISVSCFGFGGSIVHTILKQNPIEYSATRLSSDSPRLSDLPRLILYPATTEAGVQFVFDYIGKHGELKNEFFALLDKLSFTPPIKKPYRGYTLFQNNEPVVEIKQTTSFDKREVWFVMTGMGCQWPGMGLELMQIDVFAESMKKSSEVLKSVGLDLFKIISKEQNMLEQDRSITPAFVSIAAIQIAMIDLLRTLDIHPDHIIGHSTGELVCGYADGCCTVEQTLLSAYWRGKSVEECCIQPGLMAAVGLTWEQAKQMCPKDVYPACHNAEDSVTISGLKEPLEKFVDELKAKNIFARIVNAYGFPFHCEHIWPASENLSNSLLKIFPAPKPRTDRWISTSYPEEDWENEECKMAGASYFVHNLMSKVLFSDILKKIPPNAITIEIGPHFLLQSILKRSIGSNASYIGLMKRNIDSNIEFFMDAMGKLYNEGLNPKIEKLYPPVKFPVPRGTPMIQDLIKWNHSQSWNVIKSEPSSSSYVYRLHLDAADKYLLDHFIDGRSLFPATGYVYLAWKALADKLKKNSEEIKVLITDFKIHRATIISEKLKNFNVTILNKIGTFEIDDGTTLVASGKISREEKINFTKPEPSVDREKIFISGEDIYNELKIFGYEYGPAFRRLAETNIECNEGFIHFDDWISYMDAMLLFYMLSSNIDKFVLPIAALNIKIVPTDLIKALERIQNNNTPGVPVKFYKSAKICRSPGLEIIKLDVDSAPQNPKTDNSVLEVYKFIPYTHVSAQDSEFRFQKYMIACDKAVEKIEKSFNIDLSSGKLLLEHNTHVSLDDYSNDQENNYRLFSALESISRMENLNGTDLLKGGLNKFLKDIGNDFANTMLVNENCLRFIFDIISENSFKKLGVLEINNYFTPVLPKVVEYIEKYALLKFKHKIIVCKETEDISKDLPSENNVQVLPYSKLDNVCQENSQSVVISSLCNGNEKNAYDHVLLLKSRVVNKGFIILYHKDFILPQEMLLASLQNLKIEIVPTSILEKIFIDEKLAIVAKILNNMGGNLYLLRKIADPSPARIVNMSSATWFNELKSSIAESADTIWLLSEDCPSSGVIGMVNCLRNEPSGDRIRCIFMPEKSRSPFELPAFDFDEPFFRGLLDTDLLMNVFKDDCWGSFRHTLIEKHLEKREVEYSYCNVRKYGDLSSLEWMESAIKYMKMDEDRFIHIYYSALNFRDVMLATGKISHMTAQVIAESDSCVLGLEFAGRNKNNQRVAGICRSRGIATATFLSGFWFPVPDNWTLEDASTVTVVYATCYYGMIIRGNLSPGEKILIHSGTGGIGLAAMNIAFSMNCEVFTTVGTEEKRQYLLENYPRLKPENIGNSRNTSFEMMIMERTNGEGVDMVLNSLADDMFHASVRCVAKHGRFIEIGKYDLVQDNKLGLKFFLENVTFHGVFLDQIIDNNPSTRKIQNIIKKLIMDGIQTGAVKPLPRTVFKHDEVEKAFRFMGAGTHIGKIVIKIRDEEKQKIITPQLLKLPATPATYFYDHKIYIIIGGLGGFGIEVTKWVLSKGAKNVVLTSRYGARTPYHHLCLKRWKDKGFSVLVSTRNVSIREEAFDLLKDVSEIGPIGGIFNSAVVLHDAFLENVTLENFENVCAPKADATLHLDSLARIMCHELDHFVCFSSISCGKGNAGQMNYGYANSVMERVCEQRRADGLPGLAIQWGIIGEVGVVHRHMGDDAMIAGVGAQRVKSCLQTLDLACQMQHPVVCSYVLKDSIRKKGDKKDVIKQLSKIFGLNDLSDFNPTRNFGEMGVDSMVGVEIKELLESTFDISLTAKEIQEMKITDVKEMLEKLESQKSESQSTAMMSTTCVSLPLSFVHDKSVERLNERENGDPIIVLAADSKDLLKLRVLGESIPAPAFALLWSTDTPRDEAQAIASWLLQKIQETCDSSQISLIAHSSVSVIGVEMVIQSEKSTRIIKKFTILDGSSALVKAISNKGHVMSEVDILYDFIESFIPGGGNKFKEQTLKSTNLDQHVRVAVELFTKSSTQCVNKNELSEIITLHVKRALVLENYRPEQEIAQNILIIEDSMKLLANDIAEVTRSFSEICFGKIDVHRIPGLANFTEDGVLKTVELLNLK